MVVKGIKMPLLHNVFMWTEMLKKREKMQRLPKKITEKGYLKTIFPI